MSAPVVRSQLLDELPYLLIDFKQMKAFAADPIVMARAEGVRYYDVDGKCYLDCVSGIFVAALGHGHPRVIEAVTRQLNTLTFAPPLHATSTTALELVSLLRSVTPPGLKTVKLFCGGSEAVESAIKFTLQYFRQTGRPAKQKFLSYYRGYNGGTAAALSATGIARRKAVFEPLLGNFVHVQPAYCYRCPFEKEYPSCDLFCTRAIEQTIQLEGPDTVAAILVEPIINTGGILTPPDDYFPRLRQICDRYGVLMIFDEIITGFGRTGAMFASETFHTAPDILCVGKGMAGGYAPASAMIVQDTLARAFWGEPEDGIEFSHGHTFGGNPMSSAAATAVIRELIDSDLPRQARIKGEYAASRLRDLAKYGIVGEVRGKGLLLGVEFVRDPATKQPFPPGSKIGQRVARRALELGALLRADPDWLAFAPPLVTSMDDLTLMLDVIEQAISETVN
jgi:adenosylmethionine-8-amino-7-oxononanoate aminotransferase